MRGRVTFEFGNLRPGAFLGLLAGLLTLLAGCATTDDADNRSERPWNAPKSWESGMPAGMMEGR